MISIKFIILIDKYGHNFKYSEMTEGSKGIWDKRVFVKLIQK